VAHSGQGSLKQLSDARGRRRTRRGTAINAPANVGDIISYLREHRVTLTWDQAAATLRAGTPQAITIQAITIQAS
jgi:hypothetical protein